MPSGSNYVPVPENSSNYSENRVRAYSISTYENQTPSGGKTIIDGIRFYWSIPETGSEEGWGGFTGQRWYLEDPDGPIATYGRFKSEEEVYNYLSDPTGPKDLDDVFAQWSLYLDRLGDGWTTAFYGFATQVPGNCQDRM